MRVKYSQPIIVFSSTETLTWPGASVLFSFHTWNSGCESIKMLCILSNSLAVLPLSIKQWSNRLLCSQDFFPYPLNSPLEGSNEGSIVFLLSQGLGLGPVAIYCDIVAVVLLLLFQKYSTMDYIFINKYWLYSWMKFTVVFLHTRINPLIKSYLVLLGAPSSVGNHCTQSGKSSFRFHFLEDITVWLISFNIMPFNFILLAANKGISFLFLGE